MARSRVNGSGAMRRRYRPAPAPTWRESVDHRFPSRSVLRVQNTARLHRHHDDATVGADPAQRRVALVVLCLCALTTAVDITITNVALPSIGKQLDAPTNELQWVIDAYNIVLSGSRRRTRRTCRARTDPRRPAECSAPPHARRSRTPPPRGTS